jgi:hypothetical protein
MKACRELISLLTRNRAIVITIAFFLPILSLILTLDTGTRGLSLSSYKISSSESGHRHLQNSSELSANTSRLRLVKHDRVSKLMPIQERSSSRMVQLPSTETVTGAVEFVMSRRQAYQEHKYDFSTANQWKLRGHGYLFTYQNIVLAAEVPQHPVKKGPNVVKLWNVHKQTASTFQSCHLLTLWVRVNGPEIFAGSPRVVQPDTGQAACHWEFEFDVHVEGSYEVDAKMLLWNGHAPVHLTTIEDFDGGYQKNQCPDTTKDHDAPEGIIADSYHDGFLGFKFYDPLSSCCEICRRVEGCNHWTTPPKKFETSNWRNGCELYYNKTHVNPEDIPKTHMLTEAEKELYYNKTQVNPEDIPKTHMLTKAEKDQHHRRLNVVPHASGSPASNNTEVAQFLGCGWSFHLSLDFPCLSGDLDDHIFMVNRTFVVDVETKGAVAEEPRSLSVPRSNQEDLPLCRLEHESLQQDSRISGRWVRESWPGNATCPFPREADQAFQSMFEITAFDGDHPHCWHRDDLSLVRKKCLESNCRLLPQTGKWESSSVHQETEWMGSWRPYACDYYEFTNDQLQQCITQRRIGSITTSGASISAMVEQYLKVRMVDMKLAPMLSGDTEATGEPMSVVVDTLKWPHLLWHNTEDQWVDMLKSYPAVNATREEHYWVSSFFVASEREPYVQVARAERLAKYAQEILTPKGYKMINAFDSSAAFAFDTAGQGDGLHVVGPPMKAILTQIFHHMCSTVVEGTVYNPQDKVDDPSLARPKPSLGTKPVAQPNE